MKQTYHLVCREIFIILLIKKYKVAQTKKNMPKANTKPNTICKTGLIYH